jgi:hypothetical protein
VTELVVEMVQYLKFSIPYSSVTQVGPHLSSKYPLLSSKVSPVNVAASTLQHHNL